MIADKLKVATVRYKAPRSIIDSIDEGRVEDKVAEAHKKEDEAHIKVNDAQVNVAKVQDVLTVAETGTVSTKLKAVQDKVAEAYKKEAEARAKANDAQDEVTKAQNILIVTKVAVPQVAQQVASAQDKLKKVQDAWAAAEEAVIDAKKAEAVANKELDDIK